MLIPHNREATFILGSSVHPRESVWIQLSVLLILVAFSKFYCTKLIIQCPSRFLTSPQKSTVCLVASNYKKSIHEYYSCYFKSVLEHFISQALIKKQCILLLWRLDKYLCQKLTWQSFSTGLEVVKIFQTLTRRKGKNHFSQRVM